ncbi:MAG: hypothetical protein BGP05_16415 [Rhizobiales bacterium 62-47]|nr:MAG: hypothetical protein BGP05_16415 [Rhizobiales bacterium 62-47]
MLRFRNAPLLALLLPFALLLPTGEAAADCIMPFKFNITSQGPWPAYMRVKSGEGCGSRTWRIDTFTAKRLYLAAAPQHGKVTLHAPGGYRYVSAKGYTGADRFTLKICGQTYGGYEGCADLLFNVTVF